MPFSAWVLRVAHNAAIDHMRAAGRCRSRRSARRRRRTTAAARERFPTCGSRSTRCPREQRDVIVLRFLVGLSPREIAERMGRCEDAVNGLQHRGRRPAAPRELGRAAA